MLLQSGKFSLPSKKALYENDGIDLQYILIDATECPIERPKKKQRRCYSGKKRQHTVKGQVVVDTNLRIICTSIAMSNTHDFKLYKQSRLAIPKILKVYVDGNPPVTLPKNPIFPKVENSSKIKTGDFL